MANPVKLVVAFAPDGRVIERWVPMTDAEVAQQKADQAASTAAAQASATAAKAMAANRSAALALADKIDSGKANENDRDKALSLCLRETFGRAA